MCVKIPVLKKLKAKLKPLVLIISFVGNLPLSASHTF